MTVHTLLLFRTLQQGTKTINLCKMYLLDFCPIGLKYIDNEYIHGEVRYNSKDKTFEVKFSTQFLATIKEYDSLVKELNEDGYRNV